MRILCPESGGDARRRRDVLDPRGVRLPPSLPNIAPCCRARTKGEGGGGGQLVLCKLRAQVMVISSSARGVDSPNCTARGRLLSRQPCVAQFSVSHAACYETKLAGRDATDRQNKGASTPWGPHMCHHGVWRQSWRTTRVARPAPMLTCRPLAAFPPSWTRAVPLAGTTRRLSRSPRRSAAAAAAEQGRCRRRRRRARPLASRQL